MADRSMRQARDLLADVFADQAGEQAPAGDQAEEVAEDVLARHRPPPRRRPSRARRPARPARRGRQRVNVSLPTAIYLAVRQQWEEHRATLPELVGEALETYGQPLEEDEAVAWRRQRRQVPGCVSRLLRLPAEQLDRLDELARTSGLSRSGMVAVLLGQHLGVSVLEGDGLR